MLELLIAIFCCLGMLGTLFGYLRWYKNKYAKGKIPTCLAATFSKIGWKFRALMISLALWLIYPILLADGIYTSGGWLYYAPYSLVSWSKFVYAITIGSMIGINLVADYEKLKKNTYYNITVWALICGGAFIGSILREEWYIGLGVWIAWLIYYLFENYKNNKAGNPSALNLYLELTGFCSVSTCLIIYVLYNYFL